jgi:cytochrome c553
MKKVFLPLITLIVVCSLFIISCSKDNEAALLNPGGGDNPPGGSCDTVNMKYAANIVPIISNNCYNCHGNGTAMGGISLDNYAKLKAQADNTNLIGAITHANGYSPMPQGGGKLSDCDINKIKSWIANGTQNN